MADRTYTTTVGSQTVELPLVALSDELIIALLPFRLANESF